MKPNIVLFSYSIWVTTKMVFDIFDWNDNFYNILTFKFGRKLGIG